MNGTPPEEWTARRAAEIIEHWRGEVERVVHGQSETVKRSILCLVARGHVLLDDVPGVGKTTLAQALARNLPAGVPGNVINIIDQRVWNLTPEFFSYTVSKAGLWSATRMLAQALAPTIRVNAIGPGPVLKSIHQTEEDFAQEARSTLLQRGSSPAEIAAAIRFILDCPAMTGQMLALDGGQHLMWSDTAHPASATVGPGNDPSQQ